MFVLLDIKKLPDNTKRLQADDVHCLSFQLFYTLKDVPDSFTGIVHHAKDSKAMKCSHFNDPKGNSRKVIALKNKLKPGVFDGIKTILYGICEGKEYSYPLTDDELTALAKN